MHLIPSLLSALALLVATALLASWFTSRPRGRSLTALANVGEGFAPARATYLADGAITARGLLLKLGSDSSHVTTTGVSDIPLGLGGDETAAAEESIRVDLLGLQREGSIGVASGSIAAGDLLVPGATGTVRTLPGTSGTYYIIGRARKAATDGTPVELITTFPIQRIVP